MMKPLNPLKAVGYGESFSGISSSLSHASNMDTAQGRILKDKGKIGKPKIFQPPQTKIRYPFPPPYRFQAEYAIFNRRMGEAEKEILFLIQGRNVASSRYRILQYLPYLNRENIKTEVADFARKASEWPKVLKKVRKSDVLVIQRKQIGFMKTKMLKKISRKIVYDFDDTLWVKSARHGKNQSMSRNLKFKWMVDLADEVIAGNTFLAERALKYNPNVTVIPTPLDLSRYSIRSYPNTSDEVIIGWIGAHGSIHYLKRIIPILEKIHAMNPKIRLKVICDTFPSSRTLPIEKVTWNEKTEVDHLKTMDIGLMPLMEDEWSRGKCGLKVLQYFAVGIPAVATPVGINRDIVKDGETGFWARTEKEWIDRILLLASDPSLRRTMGLKARETVENYYSVEACYPIFKKVLTA